MRRWPILERTPGRCPHRRSGRLRPPLVAAILLTAAGVLVAVVGSPRDEARRPIQCAGEPPPRLGTEHGRVVDVLTRRAVLLRGANVMRGEWDGSLEHERRALPLLALEWGGNVVVRGFAAEPVIAREPAYLRQLDELVGLAGRCGLHLVLSWRSLAQNGEQPSRPGQQALEALTALADRYAPRTHVAFSLQVEPHDTSWKELQPIFLRLVDAIRGAAAPHVPLVLVPGADWGRDLRGAVRLPVARTGVVYTTHAYGSRARFEEEFLYAHRSGLPVFVGEFGPLRGHDVDLKDVRALLAVCEAEGIGWAAWVLDAEGPPTLLESNRSLAPSLPYGVLVKAAMS